MKENISTFSFKTLFSIILLFTLKLKTLTEKSIVGSRRRKGIVIPHSGA